MKEIKKDIHFKITKTSSRDFFFHKIKSELFMRFNTVSIAYITYLFVQICFQNFMPLKRRKDKEKYKEEFFF